MLKSNIMFLLVIPYFLAILEYYVYIYTCVCVCVCVCVCMGFPGGSDGKVSVCNAGDLSSIPGSGRSPGGGNGKPLWYSCL